MDDLFYDVNGLRIAAKAWGPKDGRLVVAMHGWLDNAATFDRLAPLLDPSLRLVALDLPGHGHSQHRSADAAYSLPDAAFDVAVLLHQLGPCVLLGHSMGAAIAALVAGAKPSMVTKLVLIEGLGPLIEEADQAPQRLEGAIDEQLRRHSGSTRPAGLSTGKTRVFRDLDDAAARVTEAAPMSLDSARYLLARGLQTVPGGVTWRTDPRLRSMTRVRLTEAHVAAFLRRISCETLIVLASEGWPTPPDLVELRKSYVAHRTVVTVAGRHHVHLDAPELVAPHVNAFLSASRA